MKLFFCALSGAAAGAKVWIKSLPDKASSLPVAFFIPKPSLNFWGIVEFR
ncbi:MAG: hypothetical protein ACI81P_003300 [Neolewinella sp.]|jgi:hypothetical protein